jgi:predicted TIM-barrel fold metal-dependent hydrolase
MAGSEGPARPSGPAESGSTDELPWAAARIPRLPPVPAGGYVDANSYLGEWPTRRLNGSPPPSGSQVADERLRLMDRLGIRRAAVALLDGVLLKDAGVANVELHALVRRRPERYFPLYTLNPTFPAWEEHLARCRDAYGLAPGRGAIRLYPAYQGYGLDDPRLDGALERLAGLDLPVVLTLQLEDARTHHPALHAPDVQAAEALALVRRWPRLRWVLAGGTYREVRAIGTGLPKEARVWFDIARVQGPIDCIRLLCEEVGAGRLLFGTNLPFTVAESPILELADARLAAAEDAAVRYGNAREALGVE